MPLFKRKPQELATPIEAVAENPSWRFEAVEEITPEYLKHMVNVWETQKGKFIRIGDNMVLIAAIRKNTGHTIKHRQILEQALLRDDPDFKHKILGAQAISAATDGNLLDQTGVIDAGNFYLEVGPDREIAEVVVEGISQQYGSANRLGREQTVELIQGKLGPQIEVVNDDLGIPE